MNKTQKNTVFTTIGSNGQFVVVNKSKDNAAHVNLSSNGQTKRIVLFVVDSLGYALRFHNILTTVITNIVFLRGVQTMLNHCRFVKPKFLVLTVRIRFAKQYIT